VRRTFAAVILASGLSASAVRLVAAAQAYTPLRDCIPGPGDLQGFDRGARCRPLLRTPQQVEHVVGRLVGAVAGWPAECSPANAPRLADRDTRPVIGVDIQQPARCAELPKKIGTPCCRTALMRFANVWPPPSLNTAMPAASFG
jgi:hypothetical protein